MKLPSLSFLAQAFVDACRRFPSTMLCAVLGTAAAITAIELEDGRYYDNPTLGHDFVKAWIMAMLGIALCTGLTLLAEQRGWPARRSWLLQAGGLAVVTVYYFLLDIEAPEMEYVHLPRYLAILATAHLVVAVAPYLNRLAVADFWEYNKQLFANFVVGAAYTFILFVGLALALLAVDQLFELKLRGQVYAYLFAVLTGIFNTTFFLYHAPKKFSFDEREKAYNAIFKNLCQYILIPIVGLYFLILYAYSLKILITWNLPNGWVSSLVLGFSVAGIFTYLVNYLLPDYTDSAIVRAYRKWFWWVLLPMVGLLFVAIGRRIGDYGITEERFFVAHAGVWLFAMCLYFLKSKTDNIKFIPLSLGVFVLLAVVGPFSAFEVSQRNQTAILKRLLTENGRLENGKLKPGSEALSGEPAERISSVLNFLERRHGLHRVEAWMPFPLQALPEADGAYGQASQLAHWLKVETSALPLDQLNKLYVYPAKVPQSGDVKGYSRFYRLELHDHNAADARENNQSAWFSVDSARVVVQIDPQTLDSFDLRLALQGWAKSDSTSSGALSLQNPVIDLRSRTRSARLFLQEARADWKKEQFESLYGLLFLK